MTFNVKMELVKYVSSATDISKTALRRALAVLPSADREQEACPSGPKDRSLPR